MKKLNSIIAVILMFIMALSFAIAEKVTILHINDTHSNLTPGGPRKVDLTAEIGGIAKLATLVGMVKTEDPNAILLHAGDFSIGDILYCKNFAVPELQILGSLGFNAITLGNHEFDLGPDVLTGVLTEGVKNPAMKILCANGDFDAVPDLKALISSSTIVTVNGVKVGIFGVTTPDVMMLSNPSPVTFDVEAIGEIIGEQVTALKTAGCQVVIMLSHLGYFYDVPFAQLISGINIIVGGHDHFYLKDAEEYTNFGGGTCYLVQQGANLEFAGKIELDVRGDTVELKNYASIALDGTIPEEPNVAAVVAALVADAETAYGPVFNQKLATVTETLEEVAGNLSVLGNHDTPVGNLVADAFRAWGGTEIAITASGFTSHPLYRGPIVGNDIFRMMGYGFNTDNTLGFRMVKVELSGKDLKDGIQFGLDNIFFTDDMLIQCSGMKYEYAYMYDSVSPIDSYGELVSIKVGESDELKDIDTSKKYTITTNEGFISFLYLLGMDYKIIHPPKDTTEFMVLSDYIFNLQLISPVQNGRVKCVAFVGVEEQVKANPLLSAYPNPCVSETKIEFNAEKSGHYTLNIINQQGKLVDSMTELFSQGVNSKIIDVSTLPNGIYNFVIFSGSSRKMGRFAVSR